jgi:hypothetical protein
VGGPGGVGADQHLAAGPAAGAVAGELPQRGAGDGDVVGGGVGPGVAEPRQHRQWLPAARRAVVGEAPQWMESVAAFERRRGLLLVAVRGDQGGVEVDDQRRRRARRGVRGVFPGQRPDPGPGRRAGGVDRGQRGGGVDGQQVQGAGHGRVRGHRPEHPARPAAARRRPGSHRPAPAPPPDR